MNDQKDFNDVCILQTRAALKHLPTEMTGMPGVVQISHVFTFMAMLLACVCYQRDCHRRYDI